MHKFWKKRTLIPKVKNEKSETITSRKRIANVFGEFYSQLYAEKRFGEEVQNPHKSRTTNTEGESCNDDEKNEKPEFTKDEVQTATDSLKEKVKQVTTMESVQKTSKHATTR